MAQQLIYPPPIPPNVGCPPDMDTLPPPTGYPPPVPDDDPCFSCQQLPAICAPGSDKEIVFNKNTVLGADPNLMWDYSQGLLSVGGRIAASGYISSGSQIEGAFVAPLALGTGSFNFTPPSGYGGLVYRGGSVFYYWDNLQNRWVQVDFAGPGQSNEYVLVTTKVNAGYGLNGGGTLQQDVTLNVTDGASVQKVYGGHNGATVGVARDEINFQDSATLTWNVVDNGSFLSVSATAALASGAWTADQNANGFSINNLRNINGVSVATFLTSLWNQAVDANGNDLFTVRDLYVDGTLYYKNKTLEEFIAENGLWSLNADGSIYRNSNVTITGATDPLQVNSTSNNNFLYLNTTGAPEWAALGVKFDGVYSGELGFSKTVTELWLGSSLILRGFASDGHVYLPGPLGIGISAPLHPLDVVGSVNTSGCYLIHGITFACSDGAGGISLTNVTTINGAPPGTGGGGGGVTSVFNRSGAVVAAPGDYTAAMVTNAVSILGSYADPAWITSLSWGKITGTPTMVNTFNTRSGAVVPATGDYTAAQVTNAVDQTGSYVNPAWIVSLPWSKITGAPPPFTSPLTTKGDIYVYTTADARLPIGANNSVLTADSTQTSGMRWAAPASAPVSSVFGRTGAVAAQTGDYTAAQVTNAVSTAGTYSDPTWLTGLSWSKILSPPAFMVSPLTTKGDIIVYTTTPARLGVGVNNQMLIADSTQAPGMRWGVPTASMITNAVDTSQTYSNPAWITSLAWAKITGTPSVGSYQTPWLQNIDAARFNLSNLGTTTLVSPSGSFPSTISINSAGNATWDSTGTVGLNIYGTAIGLVAQSGEIVMQANGTGSNGVGFRVATTSVTNAVCVLPNGNVGIGINTPAATLDVHGPWNSGGAGGPIRLTGTGNTCYVNLASTTAGGTVGITFNGLSGNGGEISVFGGVLVLYNNVPSPAIAIAGTGATFGAPATLNILPNNYIGINTLTPAVTLDIPANSPNNSQFRVGAMEVQSNAADTFLLSNNIYYNGSSWTYRNTGFAAMFQFGSDGSVAFRAAASGTGGTAATPFTYVTFANNGQVGIGFGLSPTHQLQLSSDDAAKPGTNTWTIASDIRTKSNVQRFEGDINVIRKLNPTVAHYNGKAQTPKGMRVVSFDPDELKDLVPHCVSYVKGKLNPNDMDETDIAGINTHEIFFHLLRAVQNIDKRLAHLENKK